MSLVFNNYSSQNERDMAEIRMKSLREHLIPMQQFIDHVNRVEQIPGNMNVNVAPHDEFGNLVDTSRKWVVPYAYTTPVWKKVCQAKFPELTPRPYLVHQFTNDDIERITRMIHNRVNNNIFSFIPEELLTHIDDTYDYGAIVHRIGGGIITFNYRYLQGVSVMGFPISAMRTLLLRFPDNYTKSQEMYEKELNYTSIHQRDFHVSYKLQMGPIQTNWVSTTTRAPIGNKEIQTQIEYLQNAIKQHIKVILMP